MTSVDNYLNGLTALINSSFPKTCRLCGKVYHSADQFLAETENMPNGRSSLKQAIEDDGTVIVEVFRNCSCGSTLMDEFNSRRDNSEHGQMQRLKFNKLLNILLQQQVDIEVARTEILNLFKGKKSDVLDNLLKNTNIKEIQ